MTPKIIIENFREEAHDIVTPPLWSDAFLLRALNEARMQAARRGRLLEDGTTPEICTIAVKVNKAIYDIDPRVIYIRRVKHSLIARPLPKCSIADADAGRPGWEDEAAGTPVCWIPIGDHQLRLFNTPDTAATLSLIVVREPLEDVTIASDEDAMDLEPRYHYGLKNFMMGTAYMKRDLIETYRPGEAKDRFDAFTAEFGPATSAVEEKWTHRKHGYDEYEGTF